MSQEKAHLARIRENQRRSRARRKDYTLELEARLRKCELLGVEANAEIQFAARRVADENRRLRALLAEKGFGAETSREQSAAVALNELLTRPKKCCPAAEGKISTVIRSGMSCDEGNGARSSTANSRPVNCISNSMESSNSGSRSRNIIPRVQSIAATDSSKVPANNANFNIQVPYNSAAPKEQANNARNANNCMSATHMISTMVGADPNAVRADLGCISGVDCEVDNQLVFSVMDRYIGGV